MPLPFLKWPSQRPAPAGAPVWGNSEFPTRRVRRPTRCGGSGITTLRRLRPQSLAAPLPTPPPNGKTVAEGNGPTVVLGPHYAFRPGAKRSSAQGIAPSSILLRSVGSLSAKVPTLTDDPFHAIRWLCQPVAATPDAKKRAMFKLQNFAWNYEKNSSYFLFGA